MAPPAICLVGYSNSGKTTAMVHLIDILTERGFHVGTIKHDAHGFEMDHQGKDSWRHKKAGARATIITSPSQIGLVMDVDHDHRPMELMRFFTGMDIVLVEGFKRADLPKIEVFRPETGKLPACKGDPRLIALICDASLDWGVPRFALSDMNRLADHIVERFNLNRTSESLCEAAVS
jgi:molybdopterin-guanine dinucleotide biosynthesis protein B